MKKITDVSEMTVLSASAYASKKRVALVPTMGYLHDGHAKLLRAARGMSDELVLSIFVNPTQFAPNEDFAAYPRDLLRDMKIAESAGVDVVFTPAPASMYPEGFGTKIEVPGLSDVLCGATRPGHFSGVATVVAKLFNIVRPHAAVFGKKDFQQYVIIKRLVTDLNLGVEITGIETVRDPDGLAMSSRNSYLSADERRAALCLPEALKAAKKAVEGGEIAPGAVEAVAKKIVEKTGLAVLEYMSVRDSQTLQPAGRITDGARIFGAIKIGRTRLIDNRLLKGRHGGDNGA